MSIWIEAALGLAAIALVAIACWREDRIAAWESRVAERIKQRKDAKSHGKRKLWRPAC